MPNLTPAERYRLERGHHHRPPPGNPSYASQVEQALKDRGLIDDTGRITSAGKTALMTPPCEPKENRP